MSLFLALISLGFITAPPALAGTISPLPYTVENAPLIIEAYAVRYGIAAKPLINTLRCESGFNKTAIGALGEVGLAQIYLKYHPTVTKEQALDPFFAVDFAARNFKEGNAKLWSCYKLTGGNSG